MARQRLQVKRVTEVKNLVPELVEALNAVLGKQVLVGIPEQANARAGDKGEPINNATLGYIHEFGSPAANIPARPFLIPGVESAMDKIEKQLRAALQAACDFKPGSAEGHLENAGILGSNGAKREINSNIPPPLTPSTIRNRRRGRQTKSRRAGEVAYLGMIAGGMDPAAAQASAGIVALVDTGQLRNSLTYVVRENPKAKLISEKDLDRATTPAIAKGQTIKR